MKPWRILALIVALALCTASRSNYLFSLLVVVGLQALPAIGLALIAGYTGQVSLGHAALYGLGAYGAALTGRWLGVPAWVDIPLAVAFVAVLAWAVGWLVFRLKGHYLAMATLALGIIAQVAFVELRGVTGGPNGLSGIPPLTMFGYALDSDLAVLPVVWTVTIVTIICAENLIASPTGLAMRAISEHEDVARSVGNDVQAVKRTIMMVSGICCALGGGLYAHYVGYLSPGPFDVGFSVKLLLMVSIGGFSDVWGVLFGVVFITFLGELLKPLGSYDVVSYGALLVVSVVYCPHGLLSAMSSLAKRGVGFAAGAIGMKAPLLSIDGACVAFGAFQALTDVTFDVQTGELAALIGPNGAGKTTLLNVLSGQIAPRSGKVCFNGKDITGQPPHRVVAQGLARSFQAAEPFQRLTVRENVMIGGAVSHGLGLIRSLMGQGRALLDAGPLRRESDAHLATVGLLDLADRPASILTAGQRRLLSIARLLASGAEMLVLDEPGAGLNDNEKNALGDIILSLSRAGKTILFIDHDMPLVSRIARRILVLDRGRIIADGEPETVRSNPQVLEAYLGQRVVAAVKPTPALPRESKPLLEIRELSVNYGGLTALDRVSLSVSQEEVVTLVGANGAGKSSLLRAIAGIEASKAERLTFDGADARGMPTDQAVVRGISLVPEGRALFPSLSVLQNLAAGRYARRRAQGIRHVIWRSAAEQRAFTKQLDTVYDLFPILRDKAQQLAGTLSGGQQQMLAIGRALMGEPRLLMLDEPSLGLAPQVLAEILRCIGRLRSEGLTILLVEQNVSAALSIADRGYVLANGRVVAEGPGQTLLEDRRITEAYLGSNERASTGSHQGPRAVAM